ncbi:MAG: CocE/NonD family hydrolase [Ilumatobacteraceae bacterium]
MSFERTGPAPRDARAIEHIVAMRDGVRLATDLYLVGGEAIPGPVVLIRLPYDKCGAYTAMPATAAVMTARGYHVVVQDVRGKFRSEGETVMFTHEAADGYDTIDWVVAQPWSDGAVAMWGDSYYGFTQLAAASGGHPALRAIAPRLTGAARRGAGPTAGERTSEVEMGVNRLYPCTYFQSNDVFDWEMDWCGDRSQARWRSGSTRSVTGRPRTTHGSTTSTRSTASRSVLCSTPSRSRPS